MSPSRIKGIVEVRSTQSIVFPEEPNAERRLLIGIHKKLQEVLHGWNDYWDRSKDSLGNCPGPTEGPMDAWAEYGRQMNTDGARLAWTGAVRHAIGAARHTVQGGFMERISHIVKTLEKAGLQ